MLDWPRSCNPYLVYLPLFCLFGLFSFHMCMRELLLSRSGLEEALQKWSEWINEIVSNISNVKYSEIPVGCICGFLFEDVICVLMKVVYLIICHWTTSIWCCSVTEHYSYKFNSYESITLIIFKICVSLVYVVELIL